MVCTLLGKRIVGAYDTGSNEHYGCVPAVERQSLLAIIVSSNQLIHSSGCMARDIRGERMDFDKKRQNCMNYKNKTRHNPFYSWYEELSKSKSFDGENAKEINTIIILTKQAF